MIEFVKVFSSGYEVRILKAGTETWVDLFIPESDIYNPNSFKMWLDTAHLRTRWKLQCISKSWRDMREKRLGNCHSNQIWIHSPHFQTILRTQSLKRSIWWKSWGLKLRHPD
jgi:hypothetical protein